MRPPVHVIGASGRSGAALCRALIERGIAVTPVVRDDVRWNATGIGVRARIADLTDPASLRAAIGDAARVACTAHARHAAAVLAAAPEPARLVFLGSTRKFTRWPDAHGNGVLAGERAVLASGRSAIMLHPTMIYGSSGENNVRRLAALLRRLPLVPLPDGGRSLVQPVHQSDVTRAVLAALELAQLERPETLVVCGADALPYREFVRLVAAADGQRPPRIVSVPGRLLTLSAPLTRILPWLPRIGSDEIRRLLEDKAFDPQPLRLRLGVVPIGLREGLALTFSPRRLC